MGHLGTISSVVAVCVVFCSHLTDLSHHGAVVGLVSYIYPLTTYTYHFLSFWVYNIVALDSHVVLVVFLCT